MLPKECLHIIKDHPRFTPSPFDDAGFISLMSFDYARYIYFLNFEEEYKT